MTNTRARATQSAHHSEAKYDYQRKDTSSMRPSGAWAAMMAFEKSIDFSEVCKEMGVLTALSAKRMQANHGLQNARVVGMRNYHTKMLARAERELAEAFPIDVTPCPFDVPEAADAAEEEDAPSMRARAILARVAARTSLTPVKG